MAKRRLGFLDDVLSMNQIGQNVTIDAEKYKLSQVVRAIYYHGLRQSKKFSCIDTEQGYLVTLVDNRN